MNNRTPGGSHAMVPEFSKLGWRNPIGHGNLRVHVAVPGNRSGPRVCSLYGLRHHCDHRSALAWAGFGETSLYATRAGSASVDLGCMVCGCVCRYAVAV